MQTIPTQLAEALRGPATTLALCVRIVRRDGVGLGFTSHDRPLLLDGMLHEPAPGLTLSAIELGPADSAEACELTGALSDDAVVGADLLAGRFDDARVMVGLVDWEQPGAGMLALAAGRIARLDIRGGQFTATVATAAAELEAEPIESCSPQCRASFGDRRCRVNLAARRAMAAVAAMVTGPTLALAGHDGLDDAYAHGRLRVLTGPAAGREARIAASNAAGVTLEQAIAPLAAGTLVELTEGCDKRFATCRDRFANALNFQGEPHVPGGDSVLRYGGL